MRHAAYLHSATHPETDVSIMRWCLLARDLFSVSCVCCVRCCTTHQSERRFDRCAQPSGSLHQRLLRDRLSGCCRRTRPTSSSCPVISPTPMTTTPTTAPGTSRAGTSGAASPSSCSLAPSSSPPLVRLTLPESTQHAPCWRCCRAVARVRTLVPPWVKPAPVGAALFETQQRRRFALSCVTRAGHSFDGRQLKAGRRRGADRRVCAGILKRNTTCSASIIPKTTRLGLSWRWNLSMAPSDEM